MSSLYKFIRKADDVRFLLKGRIKFTPIPELNDPSELVPSIIPDEVEESLSLLRKKGYNEDDMTNLRYQGALLQRLAPEFQAVSVPPTQERANKLVRSSFYDNFTLLATLLENTTQKIASEVGLFCLTKRNDALPMWAHYAEGAKGLVVEFCNLQEIFCGDDTGVLSKPIAVRYTQNRLGVTFDPRSHDSIFFEKLEDWGYEKEVRVVMPLKDCRREANGTNELYLFDIPQRHISRIILGWRMSCTEVSQVIKHVESINPNVKVFQGTISKGRFACGECLYPKGWN